MRTSRCVPTNYNYQDLVRYYNAPDRSLSGLDIAVSRRSLSGLGTAVSRRSYDLERVALANWYLRSEIDHMLSTWNTDTKKGSVAGTPDTDECMDVIVVISDMLSVCLRGGSFTGMDAMRIISKFKKIYVKVDQWVPEINIPTVRRCDGIIQDVVSKLDDAVYTYEGADVFTGDEAVMMIEAILAFFKLTYDFYTCFKKPSTTSAKEEIVVVGDGEPTMNIAPV